jgi:hypothetical protein
MSSNVLILKKNAQVKVTVPVNNNKKLESIANSLIANKKKFKERVSKDSFEFVIQEGDNLTENTEFAFPWSKKDKVFFNENSVFVYNIKEKTLKYYDILESVPLQEVDWKKIAGTVALTGALYGGLKGKPAEDDVKKPIKQKIGNHQQVDNGNLTTDAQYDLNATFFMNVAQDKSLGDIPPSKVKSKIYNILKDTMSKNSKVKLSKSQMNHMVDDATTTYWNQKNLHSK